VPPLLVGQPARAQRAEERGEEGARKALHARPRAYLSSPSCVASNTASPRECTESLR
jgi:hypothetical protein